MDFFFATQPTLLCSQPCKVSLAIFPWVSQTKALGNHLIIEQVLCSSLCPGVYLQAQHGPLGVGGGSALTKEALLYLFYTVGLHIGIFYERFL